MRITAVLLALVALSPLRADNTASPAAQTPEEQARRLWERFNTAAIVANVDGEAITAEDIRNELRPLIPQLRNEAKSQDEYRTRITEMSGKVLDSLAERELILREFKEKGMQMPPSYVNEQIEEKIIREYNGDRAEYLTALRRMGRSPLDDRKEMQERIIVDYLSGRMRKSVAELSPEKIQRFYEANKAGFTQKPGVKLSQIALWAGAAETDDDVRKLAESIIARLDKGEDFAVLAKQYSKDDSREKGGDTGWREIADLNPEIAKSVNTLADGGHTAPIEFKAGGRLSLYILRRDAFRPEGPRPVAEVREIIESKLLGDAMKGAKDQWVARLREHFYVRYYD